MLDNLPETIRLELLIRLLLVLLTFALAIGLRNLVAWLLATPLKQLFTRVGQDGLNTTIRHIIVAPTGYLLLAIAIDISARILAVNPSIQNFLSNVTRTLVIVSITLILSPVARLLAASRRNIYTLTGIIMEEALLPFIGTGVQLFLWAMVIVIVIQVWGYDVTGLIAGLGIGGLAISLAAQDTLSNLFGFAAIVSDRPFVVGEYIKTKDVEGLIERVGLRSTRVRQLDQALVSVPNSVLASSAVLNWSRLARRRIDLTLGVAYDTRADAMEDLLGGLRAMLTAREAVDSGSVVVHFIDLGESSLQILVRCYVNIADWGTFTAEKERILLEILRLFDRQGLQLAYPSRSIYIENTGDFVPQALSADATGDHAARSTIERNRG
jgi:MscS family membrane protein